MVARRRIWFRSLLYDHSAWVAASQKVSTESDGRISSRVGERILNKIGAVQPSRSCYRELLISRMRILPLPFALRLESDRLWTACAGRVSSCEFSALTLRPVRCFGVVQPDRHR
jgi:hypothetical protein